MGKALSVFIDEAGQQDMSEGYYLLTVFLHDQDRPIFSNISDYQEHLTLHGLPDIPFHMVDLIHGHGAYERYDLKARKGLLTYFSIFVQTLPISYHTFIYSRYDVGTQEELSARMRRDLVDFVYANLSEFQSFEHVPVYYDNGQQAVTRAVHQAFDYLLGPRTVEYRQLSYQDRRLSQVADYLCSVELAAMRYERGEESATYRKFFGMRGDFKRNYLKQVRRKYLQ